MSATISKLKLENVPLENPIPTESITEIDPFVEEDATSFLLGKENIDTTIARLKKIFEDMKAEELDDPEGYEAIQKTIERLKEISDQIKIEEEEEERIGKEEFVEESERSVAGDDIGEETGKLSRKPKKLDILRKMVEDFYYGDEWAEYLVNLTIKPNYEPPRDLHAIKEKIEKVKKLLVKSPKESVYGEESDGSELECDELYKIYEEETLPPDIHYEQMEGKAEKEEDKEDKDDLELIDIKDLERMRDEEKPQVYNHIQLNLPIKIEPLMIAEDDDFKTIMEEEKAQRMERLRKCMAYEYNKSVSGFFYSRRHLLEDKGPKKRRRKRKSYPERDKKLDKLKDDYERDPYADSCKKISKTSAQAFFVFKDDRGKSSKSEKEPEREYGEEEESLETFGKPLGFEKIDTGSFRSSSTLNSDFELMFEASKERVETDVETKLKPYKILSENCTIPDNMILIHQVYGYDSRRYYNFHPINNECFVYHSGKFIQVVNAEKGTMESRATATGGAVGCITTFPERSMIITGENGEDSYITFYRWPSYEILSIIPNCKTLGKFIDVSVSPDGRFLCTQGDAPEHVLGIWSMNSKELITWVRNEIDLLYKTAFLDIDLVKANLISFGKGTLKFFEFVRTLVGHGIHFKPPVDTTKNIHLRSYKIVPCIKVKSEKVKRIKEPFEIGGEGDVDEEVEEEQVLQEEQVLEEEAQPEELEEVVSEEELELESKRKLAAEMESRIRSKKKAKAAAKPKLAVKQIAEGYLDQLVDFKGDRIVCGTSEGNLKIYQYEEMICEITRCDGQPLHDEGPIIFIDYNPQTEKILTIGYDGYCRWWDYLEINEVVTKRIRETHKLEMQESFELKLININDEVIAPYFGFKCDDHSYYIQDTSFDLYRTELRPIVDEERVKKVFRTHSGAVTGMVPAPYSNYIAVVTELGHLIIYNPIRKSVILKKVFQIGCTSVFWFPLEVDETGCVLVVGFKDGTIRVVIAAVPYAERVTGKSGCLTVSQAFKPHSDRITQIKLSYTNEILASSSYDETIVLYEAAPDNCFLKLLAINAIKTNGPVNYISWKKSLQETTLLVTCSNGFFGDYKVPKNLKHFRTKTLPYYLKLKKRISTFRCLNYEKKYSSEVMDEVIKKKFELRENLEYEESSAGLSIFEEPGKPEIVHKSIKMDKYAMTQKNIFHKFDEPCPDLELLPYKVPVERPANVLFASYITDDTVWVAADEPEAGHLYEYVLGQDDPKNCYPIADLENTAITSHLFIFNDEYLIIGLKTGKLRLIKTNKEVWFDFSNYLEIAVHDPNNGFITGLNTSPDLTMLFSCGVDGNVIAYHLNVDKSKYKTQVELPAKLCRLEEEIDDYIPEDTPRIQEGRIEKVPNPVRDDILESVAATMENLRDRYEELLKQNENLPPEEQFDKEFFKLPALENEKMFFLKNKAKRIEKRYHYEFYKLKRFLHNMKSYFSQDLQTHLVHLIHTKNSKISVTTYRTFKFDDYFHKIEKEASDAIELENKMFKIFNAKKPTNTIFESVEAGDKSKQLKQALAEKDDDEFEIYLLNNKPFIEQFGTEKKDYFFRLYTDRAKMRDLIKQLQELYKIPQEKFIQCVDKVFEERLRQHVRKLKQEIAHRSSASKERVTYCLIKCLRYMHQLKEDFNKKILAVRDLKLEAVYDYKLAKRDASYIAREMNIPYDFEIPPEPPFDRFREFPESYCEGHPARFIPEGPAPPVPEEWVEEYIFIYGNRDPQEFFGEFTEDSVDELMEYLLEKGMNLKQITARIKRFERFKARLREIANISTKLSVYDRQIENLVYEKFVIDGKITQINFIASSLYQELFIVRFYAVLEEKITESMAPLIKKKCVLKFKITLEQRALRQIKLQKLDVIHNYAAMEEEALETIAKAGKYSKKLKRMFYKICKKKNLIEIDDDENTTLSEYTVETVIKDEDSEGSEFSQCPDDLAPEIFDLIVHLAKKRNEDEVKINELKILENERQMKIKQFEKKKICCDTVLAFNFVRLSKLKADKNKQIDKLNVTFIMKPNELQCFDPETNKMVDNPVFTTVESLLQHEADNITLKNEAEFTKSEVRRIFGQMKKMLSEIKQLSEKKTKVDKELKERMILRFGREVNMQEMIEFAIKGLIHSQKDKASFKNKEMKTEMKVLSNKLYDKTSELLEATRENTNKMHIKCALLEERNKTMEYLLKKKKKPLFELDALTENIEKLKEEIRKEKERKRYLVKKITQLRTKGAVGLSEEEEDDDETMEKSKSKASGAIKSDVSKQIKETHSAQGSEVFNVELKEDEVTSVAKLDEFFEDDDEEYESEEELDEEEFSRHDEYDENLGEDEDFEDVLDEYLAKEEDEETGD